METPQVPVDVSSVSSSLGGGFAAGSEVVYGLHGRCSIEAVIDRTINGETISFYKLQPQKPPLSRTKKLDPAIWIPVKNAQKQGLRSVMTKEDADKIYTLFQNREYFFSLEESWSTVIPQLEKCISDEGAFGLAKVESYLFVLKKRQVVLSPEINRFAEIVRRNLMRELSEITGQTIRALEDRMEKSLKAKLSPDN